MAHKNEQKIKGDRVSRGSTEEQDFRNLRRNADAAGQQRGATPDTPDTQALEPAQDNTADPKPHPTSLNRSGPNRKLETDNQ
jgi:hypothetical protein